MPKTEVILTHNVVGLGGESDQVKVAAGYARNYLFPQGLAIPLTSSNKRQLEALKKKRTDRESKELSSMTELSNTLSKLTLVIAVKTGEDGKVFGSVTAGTISDELRHQYDAGVDKRKIHLAHPIKSLGEHEAELRLHHDVVCTLKIRVDSLNPLSPEAAAAVKEQGVKDAAAKQQATRDAKAEGKSAPKSEKAKSEKKSDKDKGGDKDKGSDKEEKKGKGKAKAEKAS